MFVESHEKHIPPLPSSGGAACCEPHHASGYPTCRPYRADERWGCIYRFLQTCHPSGVKILPQFITELSCEKHKVWCSSKSPQNAGKLLTHYLEFKLAA